MAKDWKKHLPNERRSRMKTLDETIKKFEICNGSENFCSECPYNEERCCCDPDALYYLKEYRDECNNIVNVHDDYIHLRNEMQDELSRMNPPLTWDELKAMEGDPVWMEYEDGKGGWVIVGKFFSLFEHEEPDAYIYMYYLHNKIECSKELYGSYWKAYRKERK